MESKFQLEIFSGDFQLPSIDQESLIAHTYCKMAQLNFDLSIRNDLYYHKLPSIVDDSKVNHSGSDDIIDYLESINYQSNFVKLSQDLKFDIHCYKNFLELKLRPCLLYLFWYDEENYNENIGRWFAKKAPFPTNFLLPRLLRKEAIAKVDKCFNLKVLEDDNKINKIEQKVIYDAIDCLKVISKKLGNKQFLLDSNQPTTIDAYLFSYLAFLYKLPVKKEIIKGHIRSTPNLEQYVDRILHRYFPKYLNSDQKLEQDDSSISFKDLFFSGIVATLLMTYYAFSNGIITTWASDLSIEDQNEEEEHELENEDEHSE